MHLALASSDAGPAFAPEPFTADDSRQLAQDLSAHAASVFDALKENLPRLPDELIESASTVLSLRRKALSALASAGSETPKFLKTRIHGDYHLGQVLQVENDYIILDFEGEPARSLEERRARQSPLKDVAGMLRSFSYAAHSSLLTHASRWPEGTARLEPWARSWERIVSAAFLRAYRETAGAAPFLPTDDASFNRLLEAFLLDKALYELRYELNNRPSWVRIPLWGILSLNLGGGSHA
jgi:maltose alpha-D-glucosyltransferase/alpha-amylase